MSNLKFQNALQKKVQATPPVWFMRQAGRYHSHYQALKKNNTFMQLCKNPKLAAQVALGPVTDFDFDVAILFSDLLFPLEALGMGLEYTDAGPRLGMQLDDSSLLKLRTVDVAIQDLEFQKQAMMETRSLLPRDKSLIGFVGGPWTLFTYACEGSHGGNLTTAKSNPLLFKKFNEILLPLLKENIRLQLEGGAEVVMIFDTASGELSQPYFEQLVVPGIEYLAKYFPKKLGYYSKLTHESYLQSNVFHDGSLAGVGVDHRWQISKAIPKFQQGFVQGNFDQALLFLDTDQFRKQLDIYLKPILELSPKERAGWVSGLGHGVLPKTPEKHVQLFIQTIREVFS